VPNKIKFGQEMCSGKERGHKLRYITGDKQAWSNFKILTK